MVHLLGMWLNNKKSYADWPPTNREAVLIFVSMLIGIALGSVFGWFIGALP
jgi:hypothetical protein